MRSLSLPDFDKRVSAENDTNPMVYASSMAGLPRGAFCFGGLCFGNWRLIALRFCQLVSQVHDSVKVVPQTILAALVVSVVFVPQDSPLCIQQARATFGQQAAAIDLRMLGEQSFSGPLYCRRINFAPLTIQRYRLLD